MFSQEVREIFFRYVHKKSWAISENILKKQEILLLDNKEKFSHTYGTKSVIGWHVKKHQQVWKMMAWLRWYENTATDPKFLVVARKAGQPAGFVIALWAMLLERASMASPRGSITGFDCETADMFLEMEAGAAEAIVRALRSKGLIAEDCITRWPERQVCREDETATERKRLQRARQKRGGGMGGAGPVPTPGTSETSSGGLQSGPTARPEERAPVEDSAGHDSTSKTMTGASRLVEDNGDTSAGLPDCARNGHALSRTVTPDKKRRDQRRREEKEEYFWPEVRRPAPETGSGQNAKTPRVLLPELSPPLSRIPLLDGSEFAVSPRLAAEFTAAYPTVDLFSELARIRVWCLSNPRKRKTASGICRFLNNWLARAGERSFSFRTGPEPKTAKMAEAEKRGHFAGRLLAMIAAGRKGYGDTVSTRGGAWQGFCALPPADARSAGI